MQPPTTDRRWTRRFAVGLSATALGAVAAAGAAAAVLHGEALPGTTLAGQDVGGLGAADLRAVLTGPVSATLGGPVQVRSPTGTHPVEPAEVGLDLDAATSVRAALDAGRSGAAAVAGPLLSLLGTTREVQPALALDARALQDRVRQIATDVDRPVDPGGFALSGTRVQPRSPREGLALQVGPTADALRDALTRTRDRRVTAVVDRLPPPVDAAAAQDLAARARTVLRTPLVLGTPPLEVSLTPEDLAPLLGSTVRGDTLELTVDRERLRATVEPAVLALERRPRDAVLRAPAPPVLLETKGNASFRALPLTTAVTPGADGRVVDLAATVDRFADAVTAGSAERALPIMVVPPRVSTEALQRVDQVIGSFTTRFPGGRPRGSNIRRIAQLVDGEVVLPGEEFSLNARAGRRTTARGFVADGAIVDGELTDQVGGGVSQFSTTLYNAAWFSGVEIVAHTPHSRYISRYPPGREATLDFATIDMVFRNTTDAPVVVRTSSTGTSVTAALYGHVGDRTVVSRTGPQQSRPGGGFTVATSRTVLQGGRQVGGSRFRWTYQPPLD